jgi:hypothetical protein
VRHLFLPSLFVSFQFSFLSVLFSFSSL